jgi:hypothetical protein
MKHNHFYKVYLDDIKHIIKHDMNTELLYFIDEFYSYYKKQTSISIPHKHIFILYNENSKPSYGWMPDFKRKVDDDYGFNYLIKEGKNYGGEYSSIIRLRKLKLEKINET